MLPANGCTFFIERICDAEKWRLIYTVPIEYLDRGTYQYAECDTPEECCELLALNDLEDKRWIALRARLPQLVLPADAGKLSSWIRGFLPG